MLQAHLFPSLALEPAISPRKSYIFKTNLRITLSIVRIYRTAFVYVMKRVPLLHYSLKHTSIFVALWEQVFLNIPEASKHGSHLTFSSLPGDLVQFNLCCHSAKAWGWPAPPFYEGDLAPVCSQSELPNGAAKGQGTSWDRSLSSLPTTPYPPPPFPQGVTSPGALQTTPRLPR